MDSAELLLSRLSGSERGIRLRLRRVATSMPVRLVVAALLVALACIAPPVVGTSGSHSHPAISSTDSATGSSRETALWVHRDSHGNAT